MVCDLRFQYQKSPRQAMRSGRRHESRFFSLVYVRLFVLSLRLDRRHDLEGRWHITLRQVWDRGEACRMIPILSYFKI